MSEQRKRQKQSTLSFGQNPIESTQLVKWRRDKSLLIGSVGIWEPKPVAGFDFDGTLAGVNGSHTFPKHGNDWVWVNQNIPQILVELSKTHAIVLFTNQKNLLFRDKAHDAFVGRIEKTVSELAKHGFDAPLLILAATEDDLYRKPRLGMWYYLLSLYPSLSSLNAFYVGDAAGRHRDHSDTDYKFALNIGIPFYVPEVFFHTPFTLDLESRLDLSPIPKLNIHSLGKEIVLMDHLFKTQTLVLLCGSPASGKSTLANSTFKSFVKVQHDSLKKCIDQTKAALLDGKSVIVDKTNPDESTRKAYLDLVSSIPSKVLKVALVMDTSPSLCKHNNAYRSSKQDMIQLIQELNVPLKSMIGQKSNEPVQRVPAIALAAFAKRYSPPTIKEGFDSVLSVPFNPSFADPLDKILWSLHYI